jgi:hypothetical protein
MAAPYSEMGSWVHITDPTATISDPLSALGRPSHGRRGAKAPLHRKAFPAPERARRSTRRAVERLGLRSSRLPTFLTNAPLTSSR